MQRFPISPPARCRTMAAAPLESLEIYLPGSPMVAEQNSFGILPILYGMSLSNESVVGGTSVNATVTLLSAAPPGGTTFGWSAVIPISLGRQLPSSFPQAQRMSILQFQQAQLQLPPASSSKPAPTSMAIVRHKPG